MKRVCKKCGEEKPIEEFGKDKDCNGGYRHRCKECGNAYNRSRKVYNLQWVEYHQLLKQGLKRCTKCGKTLKLDEFYPRNCTGSASKVSSTCRKCTNIISNDFKRNNRGLMNEYQREWNRRNPEKAKASRRRSYERHIEEYHLRGLNYRNVHKEETREYMRDYCKRKRKGNDRNYIEKKIATTRRFRARAGKSYVAQIIKNAYGLPLEIIYEHPELIEVKQIQLKLKRLANERCKRTA